MSRSAHHNRGGAGIKVAGRSCPARLFWKAETIHRGDQVIYGNAWPKDFGAAMAKKSRVLSLHKEGKLTSLVDSTKVFKGLDEVPDAVEWMLTGKAIGKVVVAI